MGANQSSNSASSGGEVKTSYYELLGVEKTATEEDIKKAYRKKALELHPDRNYGDVERTTALFAEVQSAYEVLSDKQERAWYDAHEGDILRGWDGGGEEHFEHNMRVTTADDIARMLGKFRSNIKYSDAPDGFFGFLRDTFAQLAREEEAAADWESLDIPNYPSFGHKDDLYEDVVRNFYAQWSGFATKKTFAWKDLYRVSEAPDRRVRRAMEKENKRSREEGIREFNDAVRALLLFVRRRDPRYTPNTQTEEERAKAQRAATKAQAAKARAAREAMMQDAVPEWATARDLEDEQEEEEEEIEEEHYECVACRKMFKSERQYDAHEKSKKHQKAVQALKKKMRKENQHLNLDDDVPSNGAITPASGEGEVSEGIDDQEDINGSVDDIADDGRNLKVQEEELGSDRTEDDEDRVGNEEQSKPAVSPDTASTDEDDEYASRSEIEERLVGFKSKASSTLGTETPDTETTLAAPKLGKAAQKRAKKAAKQAELDQSEFKHKCAVCNAVFPSKTQMFQHINDLSHAAPISITKPSSGGGGKNGGKKKK
ncbi:DnaJ-domain-containing protein [Zopfia rhizophila CBS 207.26]|uniref:DnaJ-domain-containing protein n=1 Tax=Zopfia rhizophila CBS 207.26 TaxID=1314779 RepID=A0A6A6DHC2_9PEZI|nr:DnaJ-domain-containing protein [Zopfia rhizophila CBS 207.26]